MKHSEFNEWYATESVKVFPRNPITTLNEFVHLCRKTGMHFGIDFGDLCIPDVLESFIPSRYLGKEFLIRDCDDSDLEDTGLVGWITMEENIYHTKEFREKFKAEISDQVRDCLNECMLKFYSAKLFDCIIDYVVDDVIESPSVENGDGCCVIDIKYAIGRVICDKFGIEI